MTRVIVVDDKPWHGMAAQSILVKALPSDQYQILDPVQSVFEVPNTVEVVLCDLHLARVGDNPPPEHLSGPAAIRHLLSETEAEVVAISGIVRPTTVVSALAAGAKSFLSKDGTLSPKLWRDVVDDVRDRRHHVTLALAEMLLQDASERPLTPDFGSEVNDFLRDVFVSAIWISPAFGIDRVSIELLSPFGSCRTDGIRNTGFT